LIRKYEQLKLNNEEFQNLVVTELEGLNKHLEKRKKSSERMMVTGKVNFGSTIDKRSKCVIVLQFHL